MREYRAFFSDLAAETIISLPKRRQKKAMAACKQLALNPFVKSDYSLKDSDGRDIEHLLVDGFVLAYWVDHPVCKVMVTEIDDVQ